MVARRETDDLKLWNSYRSAIRELEHDQELTALTLMTLREKLHELEQRIAPELQKLKADIDPLKALSATNTGK